MPTDGGRRLADRGVMPRSQRLHRVVDPFLLPTATRCRLPPFPQGASMPRATSPAADAATPETNTQPATVETEQPTAAEPEPEVAEPAGPEWSNWRYVGPDPRTYSNIPASVEHGDIVTWPGPPAADGHWQPTDESATKQPDNHRAEPDAAPAEAADAAAQPANVSKEG